MATVKKKKTANKTTTTKAVARKSKGASKPDLVDDEGFAAVKGELLWKYRAISAEWNEAQALLREANAAHALEYAKAAYAPLRLAKGKIQQMQLDSAEKTSGLKEVQNAIAAVFNLENLANCSIDSTTGRIYILDSLGETVQKAATPNALKLEQRRRKTAATKTKTATGKRNTTKKE